VVTIKFDSPLCIVGVPAGRYIKTYIALHEDQPKNLLGDSARFIHVLFGTIGLAAFWIPIFAKKGAVNHVRFGKVFVWSAYIVLSAAAIALLERYFDLFQRGIGPADRPELYAFMVFLSYLTFVTFVSVRHGMSVMKFKRDPTRVRTALNLALAGGAISRSGASARASCTDTVTITPAILRLIAAVSDIFHPNLRDNVELNRHIPVRRRLTVFSHEIDERSYFGG